MFKQFTTLIRGHAHEASTAIADQHALPILRQQIRDCAVAVETSRKAVAVAMAQNERETKLHAKLSKQIEDLEARTMDAIEKDRDDLARDAADAIAHLEAERDVSASANARFEDEIARLRTVLREAEARLRKLQRGQRLAAATDKTQKLQHVVPDSGLSNLREAEGTLQRLQERQSDRDATARALTDLETEGRADTIADRMADAGIGTPKRTSADDVLARLKAKSNKSK